MNLYTFSTKSWHVRFFKWLFNQDPTCSYKTMCPYFWTYVLIFTFLPLILLIKLFGKGGTKFLAWTKDYKHNKTQKEIAHLKEICSNTNLTEKEAYLIRESKCWYRHSNYELDDKIFNKVSDLALQYDDKLDKIKWNKEEKQRIRKTKRTQTYKEYKEQKWFNSISYLVTTCLACLFLYGIGIAGYHTFTWINWTSVGIWTLYIFIGVIALAIAITLFYGIIKHMLIPFFSWLSCIKLPRCGFCNSIKIFFSWSKYPFLLTWWPIKYTFIGVFKLLIIIGDMVYSIYKKKCPIITWEETKQVKN